MRAGCRITAAVAAGLLIACLSTAHAAEEKAATKPEATKSEATKAEAAKAEVAAESEVAEAAEASHDEASHETSHEAKAPDPLAFDPDLALWTLGVFLLMLAVLSQVAWKPIMEGLKAREANIGGAIAAAQQKLDESKALFAEHQAKLAGAAAEVRTLLDEARRDADATIAQAKAEAKTEFAAERDRATRDIELAKDAAVRSLAERTAGLAIDLAGKVVRQEITPNRQSEIVREALGRFSGNGPSAN